MPTVGLPKSKRIASQQHHFFLDSQRGLQGLSARGDEPPSPTLLEKTLNRVTHQWAVASRLPNEPW